MENEDKARITAIGLVVLALLESLDESVAADVQSSIERKLELSLAAPTSDEEYRRALEKQLTFFTSVVRRVSQGFSE